LSDALNSSSSGDTGNGHPEAADASGAPAPETAAAAPEASQDQGASDAASPAADPVSDRAALLAVVKDAVAKPEDKAAQAETTDKASDAASSPTTTAQTPAAPDPNADPTEQELQGYKPSTRKLIAKLTTARNDAREQFDRVQPELAAHRELVGYLQRHQLAAEDVNLLLGVGAALRRGDFKAFLDGIEPYRQVARQSLGLDVSPDLQAQVDEGTISPEFAAELTKTRLEAARSRVEASTQQDRHAARDQDAHQNALRLAIDGWESQVRSRDPDYARKELFVRRASQALLSEFGAPRSAQEAVQLAQRAYDEVSKGFGAIRPPRQPTRPTPNGFSTPSLGAAAEPRTLLEAAKLALSRTRAGSEA
jgi:hypothetical protein